MIRNNCIEHTLSHITTPPLDDAQVVKADLCLRILSKLAEEAGNEVWARLVVSENTKKVMKLLNYFISMNWDTPSSPYDRVRKCQEMR